MISNVTETTCLQTASVPFYFEMHGWFQFLIHYSDAVADWLECSVPNAGLRIRTCAEYINSFI